jgi:gamma-glutamylcyclotransferase (GGCT)/AIG2-like uncharacterized protein YtfP
VYGTLVRGQKLHRYLEGTPGARFVGEAKIRAQLYAIPGKGYPGAVQNGGKNGFVYGELYRLSNPGPALKLLDELEGCAEGLFKRVAVDVLFVRGKRKAWAYFYAKPLRDAEPIPSGIYRHS